MKWQGRRQSSNVQDMRNASVSSERIAGAVGQARAIIEGAKLSFQDLTKTGAYDGRTLGQTYLDFVNRSSDQTDHKLK